MLGRGRTRSGLPAIAAIIAVAIATATVMQPLQVLAQSSAVTAEPTSGRFLVEGDRIVFAGDVPRDDDDSIAEVDVEEFLALARANPQIRTLELRSEGGYLADGLNFAHAVHELGFDTIVAHYCLSSCTDVFVAGDRRTLEPGARLGFHGTSWGREAIKSFYEEAREDYGWMDEMAYASWVYQEGMRDQRKSISHLVSRGIGIDFILRTLAVDGADMWYPTRSELIEAGVLHDGTQP
jgi:hypothetical protein